jgi:hypothetical protein
MSLGQDEGSAPRPRQGPSALETPVLVGGQEEATEVVDGSELPHAEHPPINGIKAAVGPIVRAHASHDAGPGQSPGLAYSASP